MKNIRKITFCFILQIKHLSNEMLVHQSTYTENFMKQFHMDKSHPLNSLMVAHFLKVKNIPFHPKEDNKEIFGLKVLLVYSWPYKLYMTKYNILCQLACKIQFHTKSKAQNEVKTCNSISLWKFWLCFIWNEQNFNCLDMWMMTILQTLTKLNFEQSMYLLTIIQYCHRDQSSKQR